MARRKMKPEIDWLSLEMRIRQALREYRDDGLEAHFALQRIANALGDETGRGCELDGNEGYRHER